MHDRWKDWTGGEFTQCGRHRHRCDSIKYTEFERREIAAIKKELNHEYEAQLGLVAKTSKAAAPTQISSSPRT